MFTEGIQIKELYKLYMQFEPAAKLHQAATQMTVGVSAHISSHSSLCTSPMVISLVCERDSSSGSGYFSFSGTCHTAL